MATMRKCAWFACLFSVVCISGIVAPIPMVDATLSPIVIPNPFPITVPFPFTPPRSPPPPPPRSPPPPPPQSPPPPPPQSPPPPLPQSPPPPPPQSPPPPPPQSPPPPPPLLQSPPLPPVNVQTLISFNGTVYCTLNGTIRANDSQTPVFPNATVELRCGPGNTTLGTGITNTDGRVNIVAIAPAGFSPVNCTAAVVTPLSNCNATFPDTSTITVPVSFTNGTIQTYISFNGNIPLAVLF